MNNDKYLITGCNTAESPVWKITFPNNKTVEFNTAIRISYLDEESTDTDMVCIYVYYIYI